VAGSAFVVLQLCVAVCDGVLVACVVAVGAVGGTEGAVLKLNMADRC
jgi:hypothetical protein